MDIIIFIIVSNSRASSSSSVQELHASTYSEAEEDSDEEMDASAELGAWLDQLETLKMVSREKIYLFYLLLANCTIVSLLGPVAPMD